MTLSVEENKSARKIQRVKRAVHVSDLFHDRIGDGSSATGGRIILTCEFINIVAATADERVLANSTMQNIVTVLAGELIIAGFPLEELALNATLEETVYLLWHDALPTATQLADFRQTLVAYRDLPTATLDLLRATARISSGRTGAASPSCAIAVAGISWSSS